MQSDKLKKLAGASKTVLKSRRGHNVLLYLLFACVALLFWFILSLDNEVQRDFEIPVVITDVPDSIVLIGDAPSQINVVVKAKGSQLLPYVWGHLSELKLKFSERGLVRNVYSLGRARLDARIRDYFGQSVQVISIRPDSIYIPYTSGKGRRLPIALVADVTPNLQCVLNGDITTDIDTVTVFTTNGVGLDLKKIETEKLVLRDIKDTTVVSVPFKKIPGVRIIPDKVNVRIPVEPLIAKKRSTPIEVVNLPRNVGFLTFPSTIEVSYLVPMSKYNEDMVPFKVYVDYNTLNESSGKIKLNLAPAPSTYRNVTLPFDSVEYVLEVR